MTQVPTLGGTFNNVYGQNELGHVVGWSNVAGDASYHGYLYADGVLTEMGTLGGAYSLAGGISNSGQIVGWAQVADGTNHAAVFVGGVAQDLNDLIPAGSGWELTVCRRCERGRKDCRLRSSGRGAARLPSDTLGLGNDRPRDRARRGLRS